MVDVQVKLRQIKLVSPCSIFEDFLYSCCCIFLHTTYFSQKNLHILRSFHCYSSRRAKMYTVIYYSNMTVHNMFISMIIQLFGKCCCGMTLLQHYTLLELLSKLANYYKVCITNTQRGTMVQTPQKIITTSLFCHING